MQKTKTPKYNFDNDGILIHKYYNYGRWDVYTYCKGDCEGDTPYIKTHHKEFAKTVMDVISSSEQPSSVTFRPLPLDMGPDQFLFRFECSNISCSKLDKWYYGDDDDKKVTFNDKEYTILDMMTCPISPREAESRGPKYQAKYIRRINKQNDEDDIAATKRFYAKHPDLEKKEHSV